MIREGRELDLRIAQEVLGYAVIADGDEYYETTPRGNRLLPHYSTSMGAAWDIVERMGITLIPIADGMWFALVGHPEGWGSPADFVAYLGKGDYAEGGAAMNRSAPLSVCIAALSARAKSAQQTPSLKVIHGFGQRSFH